MAITNPNTIKFINEVRPVAEKARALRVLIDNANTTWFAGVNTTVPNTTEVVDDGRPQDGILTGIDVNGLMSVLGSMNSAGNAEIIQKMCVRALEVS